ncbi:PKD domain-containing protein [Hymenobacter sp. B81]|uniref:PKD domain-containing protein n=1 Tax=Hymenobacter sp. B81 TaxID=3344878 RepID=UPI0037DC9395
MKTILPQLLVILLLGTAACKEAKEEPSPQRLALTAEFIHSENPRCKYPVQFETSASGATKLRWDFGDGGKDSVANPTHTFATAGTYSVRLTVEGPQGKASNLTPLVVGEALPLDFQVSGLLWHGRVVSFSTLNAAPAWATAYQWNFGDGATSTASNPTHTFSQPGAFVVSLTATGPTGSAIVRKNVVVGPTAAVATLVAGRYRCARIMWESTTLINPVPVFRLLPADTITVGALPDGQIEFRAPGPLATFTGWYPTMRLSADQFPYAWPGPTNHANYRYEAGMATRPSGHAYFQQQGDSMVYKQWTGGNAAYDRYTCNCKKLK